MVKSLTLNLLGLDESEELIRLLLSLLSFNENEHQSCDLILK